MRFFTKGISLILSLALLLTALPLAGLAESSKNPEQNPVIDLLDACQDLLLATENVTIDGQAVFSLDGTRFKTAVAHYVQDGYNSLYKLQLFTPTKKGKEIETGFTVIANRWDFYSMETYHAGAYTTGMDLEQSTILRSSFLVTELADLIRSVAVFKQDMLLEHMETAETDAGRKIHLFWQEGEKDDVLNAVLTLAGRFVMQRFFASSPDELEDYGWDFDEYMTKTIAICETTEQMSLQKADCTVEMNGSQLTSLTGDVTLALKDVDGQVRMLNITFGGTLGEYGSSHVDPFDPDDYHVELAEGWEIYNYRPAWDDEEDVPVDLDRNEEMTEEEKEACLQSALQFAAKAGYPIDAEVDAYGFREGDTQKLEIADMDGKLDLYFAFMDDTVYFFQDMKAVWLDSDDLLLSELPDDDAVVEESMERLMAFLKENHPMILQVMEPLQLEMQMTADDGTVWLQFGCETSDPVYNTVSFVVRAGEDWRIESYSLISFG